MSNLPKPWITSTSTPKCEVCLKSVADVNLFRQNAKGEQAIWRCLDHTGIPIDNELIDLTNAIKHSGTNQND